jgi:hypothetical protein
MQHAARAPHAAAFVRLRCRCHKDACAVSTAARLQQLRHQHQPPRVCVQAQKTADALATKNMRIRADWDRMRASRARGITAIVPPSFNSPPAAMLAQNNASISARRTQISGRRARRGPRRRRGCGEWEQQQLRTAAIIVTWRGAAALARSYARAMTAGEEGRSVHQGVCVCVCVCVCSCVRVCVVCAVYVLCVQYRCLCVYVCMFWHACVRELALGGSVRRAQAYKCTWCVCRTGAGDRSQKHFDKNHTSEDWFYHDHSKK